MQEKLDEYILSHISPEDDYLYRLYRATQIHLLRPRMASGHLQGQLLRMLCQMIRPQRVLEIGTGTGYGVDIIAPNASEFVTLDKYRSERIDSLPANVRFVEATVPPLPFEDETFDYVVSFQVIEHIKSHKSKIIVGCNISKNDSTPEDEAPQDFLRLFRPLYQYADYDL